MEPIEDSETSTFGLQIRCSAAELYRHMEKLNQAVHQTPFTTAAVMLVTPLTARALHVPNLCTQNFIGRTSWHLIIKKNQNIVQQFPLYSMGFYNWDTNPQQIISASSPIAVVWLRSTPYHPIFSAPFEERLIIIRQAELQSLCNPSRSAVINDLLASRNNILIFI